MPGHPEERPSILLHSDPGELVVVEAVHRNVPERMSFLRHRDPGDGAVAREVLGHVIERPSIMRHRDPGDLAVVGAVLGHVKERPSVLCHRDSGELAVVGAVLGHVLKQPRMHDQYCPLADRIKLKRLKVKFIGISRVARPSEPATRLGEEIAPARGRGLSLYAALGSPKAHPPARRLEELLVALVAQGVVHAAHAKHRVAGLVAEEAGPREDLLEGVAFQHVERLADGVRSGREF